MAISADGRYAFLANTENNGIVETSSVSKLDLVTDRAVATFAYPQGTTVTDVAANPREDAIYVAYVDSANARHVQSFSQSALRVLHDVSFPQLSGTPLVVSPIGDLLFAGAYVLRASDLGTVGFIPTALSVGGVAVTKDGSTLYAVGNTTGNLWAVDVVDVKSLAVTDEIPTQLDFATLIALSADETQVIVGASNQKVFNILSLSTAAATSYPLPWGPGSVVLLSDGSKVIFGSSPNLYDVTAPSGIVVFDFATQQVSAYETFAAEQVVASPGPQVAALDVSGPAAITPMAPSGSIAGTIFLGTGYGQGAFDQDDGLILFPLQNAQSVQILNAKTLKPEVLFPLPGVSSWVSYTAGLAYALVDLSAVTSFSPVSMKVTGTFTLPPVDYQNTAYDISPAVVSADGATLYMAFDYAYNYVPLTEMPQSYGANIQTGLAIYDTATTKLLRVIPENWIGGIALAPGGSHGYASIQESNGALALSDMDLVTGKTLRAVRGKSNAQFAPLLGVPVLSPDGSTIYVAIGSEILIVDATNFKVTRSYRNDNAPISLALTPDGLYLYATSSNQVLIFNAQSLSLIDQVTSESEPTLSQFIRQQLIFSHLFQLGEWVHGGPKLSAGAGFFSAFQPPLLTPGPSVTNESPRDRELMILTLFKFSSGGGRDFAGANR